MPGTQAQTRPKNRRFWDIRAAAEGGAPPELILYGDIASETWWGDEVTPRQFSEELNALGAVKEIVVRINSGGGDVFAANAIYTRLKDNPAKITVKIDGWAASAATIIAMAGDVIEIPANGIFMIHQAKMGLLGYYGEADLSQMIEEIRVINQSIVNGYVLKTGKSAEEIAAIMERVGWYDGKEAVEAGFCDRLMFEDAEVEADANPENARKIVVNSVTMDLSRLPEMPVALLNRCATHTRNGFSDINHEEGEGKNMSESNRNQEIRTADDLRAAFPTLVQEIENRAAAAERNRIQDIESVALAGFENIVQDAKFQNPIDAGEVARRIVAEQKKLGGQYIQNRAQDVKDSRAGEVNAGAGMESTADSVNADEKAIAAALDKIFPETK